MDEITVSQRMSDQWSSHVRAPYLTTHRALGACMRELDRLSDLLIAGAGVLAAQVGVERPVVRRPPGRCLIQLGPVALTMTWLRSTLDSAATGELLVNVWQGSVAPRMIQRSERPGQDRMPAPATALWEQVLVADAEAEATWLWNPRVADAPMLDSPALAALCVERLRSAWADQSSVQECQ